MLKEKEILSTSTSFVYLFSVFYLNYCAIVFFRALNNFHRWTKSKKKNKTAIGSGEFSGVFRKENRTKDKGVKKEKWTWTNVVMASKRAPVDRPKNDKWVKEKEENSGISFFKK